MSRGINRSAIIEISISLIMKKSVGYTVDGLTIGITE